MRPSFTSDRTFDQYVSNLLGGVDKFAWDSKIQVYSIKQPVQLQTLNSGDVSQWSDFALLISSSFRSLATADPRWMGCHLQICRVRNGWREPLGSAATRFYAQQSGERHERTPRHCPRSKACHRKTSRFHIFSFLAYFLPSFLSFFSVFVCVCLSVLMLVCVCVLVCGVNE